MDQLQCLDHQTVVPSIEEGKRLKITETHHLSCQLVINGDMCLFFTLMAVVEMSSFNRLKLEPNTTVLPCAIKLD